MDLTDALERLLARQRQILSRLPGDMRREWEECEIAIRKLREMAGTGESSFASVGSESVSGRRAVSGEQIRKLTLFLQERPEASTGEIIEATRIPKGSLGRLLRDHRFEKAGRGKWRLAFRGQKGIT